MMSRLLLAALCALGLLTHGCTGARQGTWHAAPSPEASGPARFRVLTLNTAHGVGQPALAFLANRRSVEKNLAQLAQALQREGAEVVALQEVHVGSGPGRRGVDQAAVIAEGAGYAHRFFGVHHGGGGRVARGTALLSASELASPRSTAFAQGAGDDHGWVSATVRPRGLEGVAVDVVSVHLDPFSARARASQMDDLVRVFRARTRPLVVMGDFNTGWRGPGGVERLAARLGLRAFSPTGGARTFPSGMPVSRVDWILVSPELRILRYRTFTEPATDHLGVVAELGFSPSEWVRREGRLTRARLAASAVAGDTARAVVEASVPLAPTGASGETPPGALHLTDPDPAVR